MNKWLIFFTILMHVAIAMAEDYRSVFAKVQSKIAQIHSLEAQVNHLIEAKNHSTSSEQAKLYVDEMIRTYDQLKVVHEDYSKEMIRLKYQYPDQGETFQRRYPRLELRTLDEMEVKYGLNGELDRVLVKMRQVYGPISSRSPASTRPDSKYEWYMPPALVK